jgi:hypothetical protein
MKLSEGLDSWIFKTSALTLLGLVLISKGDLSQGTGIVTELLRISLESEISLCYCTIPARKILFTDGSESRAKKFFLLHQEFWLSGEKHSPGE